MRARGSSPTSNVLAIPSKFPDSYCNDIIDYLPVYESYQDLNKSETMQAAPLSDGQGLSSEDTTAKGESTASFPLYDKVVWAKLTGFQNLTYVQANHKVEKVMQTCCRFVYKEKI
ncbi:hypothetical protein ACROYT_G013564 [Oculina patagonica]